MKQTGIAIPIHNLEGEGSSPNLQETREIQCQPHRQYVIIFQQNPRTPEV